MNIDVQDYLRLVEGAGTLAFYDIEASGLRGDYGSVLVVSVKPFKKKPITLTVKQPGHDQKLVKDAKALLEQYDCIAGYYSKGFDLPMLNTRLTRWNEQPIRKIHHLDLYFSLKSNLLTARKSQGHLLSWLGTKEEKMTVSADVWSAVAAEPHKHIPTLIQRCESDVAGLEALYNKTKHLFRDIKLG